jgi:hypothetical protein
MGEKTEAKLREEQIAGIVARGAGDVCATCGKPLRSSRERLAQACAYHLDVKPGTLRG